MANPDNEVVTIPVGDVTVPVFSARWLLREKIVTAFERQGSRKSRTDIDDAKTLLDAVPPNGLDMSGHKDAVQHMCEMIPESKTELQLRVVCPDVFGQPWTWNDDAQVYWRFEAQLYYMSVRLREHKFKWDEAGGVWYFEDSQKRAWYYSEEDQNIVLWV